MDTKNNETWQDLIESREFDQLSNSEKAFVLGQSTENKFRSERTVLLESKTVYAEVEPRPLIWKEEKKGIVIPLYQTVLAIAASFILAFFLFRSNGSTIKIVSNPTPATTDTVYVEKRIVDTLIQTKTEYIRLPAMKSTNDVAQTFQTKSSPSSVLSNQGVFEADLSSTTLINKGTSASNDETLGLMESWVAPN